MASRRNLFFDDCWNQPDAGILSPDYKISRAHLRALLPGNPLARFPGENVRQHVRGESTETAPLKAYVQDIVNAHKNDKRITFWETYNEPNHSAETKQLLNDAYDWIHETGTTIPITATGRDFSGEPVFQRISSLARIWRL